MASLRSPVPSRYFPSVVSKCTDQSHLTSFDKICLQSSAVLWFNIQDVYKDATKISHIIFGDLNAKYLSNRRPLINMKVNVCPSELSIKLLAQKKLKLSILSGLSSEIYSYAHLKCVQRRWVYILRCDSGRLYTYNWWLWRLIEALFYRSQSILSILFPLLWKWELAYSPLPLDILPPLIFLQSVFTASLFNRKSVLYFSIYLSLHGGPQKSNQSYFTI